MGICRLVQSRQINDSWQSVALECIAEERACLWSIADVFFNHSLSLLLFFLMLITFTHRKCLSLSAIEQERQREWKQRTQKKKTNLLIYRGRAEWSASLAFMMNGTATLHIRLLFNLSALVFLPPSYYFSLLNESILCSSTRAPRTVKKALHSKNIRLIYTAVIRPLDLKQSGTRN